MQDATAAVEVLVHVHAASRAFEEALGRSYAKTAAAKRAQALIDGITECVRFLFEHSDDLASAANKSAEYQEQQHEEHPGMTCVGSMMESLHELVLASLDAFGTDPVAPAVVAALAEYASADLFAAALLKETSGGVPYVEIVQRSRRKREARAEAAPAPAEASPAPAEAASEPAGSAPAEAAPSEAAPAASSGDAPAEAPGPAGPGPAPPDPGAIPAPAPEPGREEKDPGPAAPTAAAAEEEKKKKRRRAGPGRPEAPGPFWGELRRHSTRLLANLPVYEASLQGLFGELARDAAEDPGVRENAIRGLAHGASHGRTSERNGRVLAATLVKFAAPGEPDAFALEAAKGVHNVAVRWEAAREQLAEFAPRSLRWLAHPDVTKQTIACTVLTHLVVACGAPLATRLCADGVVPPAAALLKSHYPDVPKFALILLRNLAAEAPESPPIAAALLEPRGCLVPLLIFANKAALRLSGDDAALAESECLECAGLFANLAAVGPDASARLLSEASLVRAAGQWLGAGQHPAVQHGAVQLCFNIASYARELGPRMLKQRSLMAGLADILRNGGAARDTEDDVIRIFGTLYFAAAGDRPPLCAPRERARDAPELRQAPAAAEDGAGPSAPKESPEEGGAEQKGEGAADANSMAASGAREAALAALFGAGALPGLARVRASRGPPPCPPREARRPRGPRPARPGGGGAAAAGRDRAAAETAMAAVVEELATALAEHAERSKAAERARRRSAAGQAPFVAALAVAAVALYLALARAPWLY
eukprot:tig00000870_g5130.t1